VLPGSPSKTQKAGTQSLVFGIFIPSSSYPFWSRLFLKSHSIVKKLTLSTFLFLTILFTLSAQDTIRVQTFKWEDNHRSDTFDFPDNPNQTYRKILMKYNMRCHDAVVGNGSNGCLEWDYSCNTFITDPSRIDSSKATAPDYTISNFNGPFFIYSNVPTYTYTAYTHHETSIEEGINPKEIHFSAQGPIVPFSPEAVTYRYQAILTTDELIAASMDIDAPLFGLRMALLEPGSTLGFLKIRLKNTDQNFVGERPDESDLTEVYFKSTHLTGSEIEFPFYTPFTWNGQNLLVDISFTTSSISDAPTFPFFESTTNERVLISSTEPEGNLYFGGASNLDLDPGTFHNIHDEITLSFWAYGDASLLPTNTHFVDGKDAAGQRHATIHLPWSNGEVYWDCGNDGTGFDRINKPVDPADYKGRWSHWAFTKNTTTGVMNIYLNGELFHSGTGKTKQMNFDALRFGQSLTNSETYYGSIDEIQIWDKALDANTIRSWMMKHVDDTHPDYAHLRGYFKLNEGSGNTAVDASSYHLDAPLTLPLWRQVRGDQLFHHFTKSNLLPEFTFYQHDYVIDDSTYTVLDSVLSPQHQVIHFGVDGTDLVRLDTQYVYPAGNRPVYNESGILIDTILAAADGTITINTLNYYAKQASRFELLSLVTPYGINLDLGQKGKTFTFDVTDFAPVLKGRKKLSVEFGGENQEELDIEFWYITGTPDRDVLDIQNIWPQGRGYFNEIQSDARFEPRLVPLNPNAFHYKVRSAITGHEQNGEFVPRQHYINVNGGDQEFLYDVWKSCSRNPIYPQGGTWIFDRAGWCPGMATDVHQFSLDDFVSPGQTVEFDYGINGGNMSAANYLVNNLLVTYGPYHSNLDASLEAVVRPNNTHVEYARLNPACNTPTILVKNTGSEWIESLNLSYETAEWNTQTYYWTGAIPPQGQEEIILPEPPGGFWQEGGLFTARILQANDIADGNAENNIIQSTFDQVTVYNYADPVQLRLQTNNTGSDYFYNIKNEAGSVVFLRNNMANNTVYTDDLMFPPGCYTLDFRDSGQDGLSFWFFPENGSGSLRFQRKLQSGNVIPLFSFNPDFGGGVRYDFHLGALTSATEETEQTYQLFSTYPNPAMDELKIDLMGFEGKEISFQLADMTGQIKEVKKYLCETTNETTSIDLSRLVPGMYLLQATDGKRNWVREVVKME
jgi:hypothetical protein